jgi:aspartate/methionine/tyrosine aminotransferase
LRALRHEETEYVPIMAFGPGGDASWVGVFNPIEKGQQANNMIDGYGVPYSLSAAAVGGMNPTPGKFLLKDITRWKKDVTFLHVKNYNWQKLKDEEYAVFGFDPDNPSGHYLNKKDALRLGEYFAQNNKMLILDESFIDFCDVEDDKSLLTQDVLNRVSVPCCD